jgi:alkanesulfonate monooxygenase SsuD/methylene tetrahydromethanopterin reductase-like flavin-dependent oxidoreductase (luciferase family)
MHSDMSLFSGRQPLDTAVLAQKAEALGCDALWRRNIPSSPCRAARPPLAPLGAVSQM